MQQQRAVAAFLFGLPPGRVTSSSSCMHVLICDDKTFFLAIDTIRDRTNR